MPCLPTLSSQRRLLAAKIQDEACTFDSAVLDPQYAETFLYDLKWSLDQQITERRPVRPPIGMISPVPGARYISMTFSALLKGRAAAGDIPALGKFLRACGHSQTVNSGVAANGTIKASPLNKGSYGANPITPVISGTYSESKNAILRSTITTITTDTSVVFQHAFKFSDGTAWEFFTTTQTDGSAQTIGNGVSWAIQDPAGTGGTSGWRVGDEWFTPLTSASTVDVIYKPRDDEGEAMSLALYEDGRRITVRNARGTVKFTMNRGEPAKAEFNMMGVINSLADASFLADVPYDDEVRPPAYLGVGLEFLGNTDLIFADMSIDVGNQVVMRDNANNAEGYEGARITERSPKGTFNPEAQLFADFNGFDEIYQGNFGAMEMAFGSVAGNRIEFTARNVQPTGLSDADRNKLVLNPIDFALLQPGYDENEDYSEYQWRFY